MDEDQLITLVEEILEAEPGSIAVTDSLADAGWDSLANISFIAEIDQERNVTLNPQRLANAKTPADLLVLVQESLGASK